MGGGCALQFLLLKCLLKANLQSHSNFTPFPPSLVNQLLINAEANQQRPLLCFFPLSLSLVFLRITTCKGKHKAELVRLALKQAQPAPFKLLTHCDGNKFKFYPNWFIFSYCSCV